MCETDIFWLKPCQLFSNCAFSALNRFVFSTKHFFYNLTYLSHMLRCHTRPKTCKHFTSPNWSQFRKTPARKFPKRKKNNLFRHFFTVGVTGNLDEKHVSSPKANLLHHMNVVCTDLLYCSLCNVIVVVYWRSSRCHSFISLRSFGKSITLLVCRSYMTANSLTRFTPKTVTSFGEVPSNIILPCKG